MAAGLLALSIAVIAEKPSVARSIAEVLGARERGPGVLRGSGYVVTWALGHLVGLAEPHEMVPSWKAWRTEHLPMLPQRWALKVLEATRGHFDLVQAVLQSPEIDDIVCATDAGREGELIFRYIYQKAGCTKPVRRLWVSSLTPDAIRAGFRALRPSSQFDHLAAAAEARSRADWLVGMNFSRAYTLSFGPDLLSVGRVQTPTLAMLVEREKAIRTFVPEKYREVEATFGTDAEQYSGVWFRPAKTRNQEPEESLSRLPADGVLADAIRARCEGKPAKVVEATGSDKSFPPPLLYDLTELQRHANRLYGMTAQATLRAAQSLYESHKLLSYPRTDSRHLSSSIAATLPSLVDVISPSYRDAMAPGTGQRALSKRFVDDSKVTDHHAIIPTSLSRIGKKLTPDEERLYDLVCRRLLMAWHADYRTRVTKVVTWVPAEARPGEPVDLYRSSGTVVTQLGWKALDLRARRPVKQSESAEPHLPDGLTVGQVRTVSAIQVHEKQTSPPPPLTDALLLTAMESAGKTLDSRELEEAMRERGLGTPATRASILETLIARGYVERKGKALRATDKGIALIDIVHESVKSPQLTGEWELALKRLERGQGSVASLMAKIERFVGDIVASVADQARAGRPKPELAAIHADATAREGLLGRTGSAERAEFAGAARVAEEGRVAGAVRVAEEGRVAGAARVAEEGRVAGAARVAEEGRVAGAARVGEEGRVAGAGTGAEEGDLVVVLRERFRHEAFRPNQRQVCEVVTAGHDALLVMPTGSGKSLCYQLPGIARGGTTLVISPLIALMEDQVAKLCEKGFRTERIHSGRSRELLRAACRDYLDGSLDFLMIAPERLNVPGFSAFLARRKPALIAVDEAHCISQWGHDFRPDYRLLGRHLPMLRPSPILALTATATPRVQDDIVSQLGIPRAHRFIHGFRRDNLAIEIAECPRVDRVDRALGLLARKERRPAIVYVPSRKMAEEVAHRVSAARLRAAPYHAGLDADRRDQTQRAFQEGDLDVVVATIAFGMGIDKADIRTVIHLALPGTLESYYQEIGRAGRDGAPARAVLFYSWGDRRMHESFLERDYPSTAVLEDLLAKVPENGIDRTELLSASGLDPRSAEPALGKLWMHGAVTVDEDDVVCPAQGAKGMHGVRGAWQSSYETLRSHRLGQLDDMVHFAEARECRMVGLVRHFGESRDMKPCGLCDTCRPGHCVGHIFRAPTASEAALSRRILECLQQQDGCSVGTLCTRLGADGCVDRTHVDRVLAGFERAGVVVLTQDEFEKDGKTISFRRVHLRADRGADGATARLLLEDGARSQQPTRKRKRGRRRNAEPVREGRCVGKGIAPRAPKSQDAGKGQRATRDTVESARPASAIESRLRQWRQQVAKLRRVPVFVIMKDETLRAIASTKPRSMADLLRVKGIGNKLVETYGVALLRLIAQLSSL